MMAYGLEDRQTIYALATGPGKAAVAVVRISGRSASRILERMTGGLPSARRASFRHIHDPSSGEVLDEALVIWFPGPRSFTGEDCAELQIHGGRAVTVAVLRSLAADDDLRLAGPGEFARRAFQNGKLDLTSVEGLGDLIDAETEQQRRFAVLQMSGALSSAADGWRASLIEAMVLVESELDFSDEADTSMASFSRVRDITRRLRSDIAPHLQNNAIAERLRGGLSVLIGGPPNAGKSTLLNAIARRDVAIVSEVAGTTRDLIEAHFDLDGFPVNLIDTAGIRPANDPIEKIGIERALHKSGAADLVLWLVPAGEGVVSAPPEFENRPIWYIETKSDLEVNSPVVAEPSGDRDIGSDLPFRISAKIGYNIVTLIDRLKIFARDTMSVDGSTLIANERQRIALATAYEALVAVEDGSAPLEIVAENLRRACYSLECLVGRVGVEDVLDGLFSRFCIGK